MQLLYNRCMTLPFRYEGELKKTRVGFACKVLGATIPSHDTRRWQSHPHLRVSIGYLHQMFDYLHENNLDMYRLSSDIAPYYTDPTRPEFGKQVAECEKELEKLGQKASLYNLRLSSHPGQYVVLNSPDEGIYQAAVRDLQYHCDVLDAMGQPETAKMILHVGGVYGAREEAMERFIRRYGLLSDRIRARLVVENDDKNYPVSDVLAVHGETGVPIVFDNLHHRVLNPEGLPEAEALQGALQTWPVSQRPKIHYSDERVETRMVKRRGQRVEAAPAAGQHSNFIGPRRFSEFMRSYAHYRPFDVMLEAKAKDLAVFRLRSDLQAMGVTRAA